MTAPEGGAAPWQREPNTEMRTGELSTAAGQGSAAILSELEFPEVPLEWEPHTHSLHLLAWVRGGSMTVRLKDQVSIIPEGWGMWLPADVVHGGRLGANVRFQDAYFDPERTPRAGMAPTVIAINPVLESLLTYLAGKDLAAGARARAEAVVFDVLEPAGGQFTLPVPQDRRIQSIVEALLEYPGDGRSLDDWAKSAGCSAKTIARAFRASSGLSFAAWRQTLRMHRAVTLLAEGYDVQEISALLGYAQPSTFIAAFRRVMGSTPGRFMMHGERANNSNRLS